MVVGDSSEVAVRAVAAAYCVEFDLPGLQLVAGRDWGSPLEALEPGVLNASPTTR